MKITYYKDEMVIFHKQQTNPECTVYMVLFIFNSNSRTLTEHNKSIRAIGMACLRVTSDVLCLNLRHMGVSIDLHL